MGVPGSHTEQQKAGAEGFPSSPSQVDGIWLAAGPFQGPQTMGQGETPGPGPLPPSPLTGSGGPLETGVWTGPPGAVPRKSEPEDTHPSPRTPQSHLWLPTESGIHDSKSSP